MKKLMIAVAVAGAMFSVNGFAASNSASPVSFQEVGFQYSNDALFANASNSDGAHIRMEGTIPQRLSLIHI